ncbi:MAG: glycosyltransferase [Patescibacteria group bacterium]
MKVALVHDYLGEFGGAERVLETLAEMFPEAPIYTAFYRKGGAYERFKNRDIRVSWAHHILFFSTKLHSPLRFLAPLIWESFDFKDYDLVISSASWYITKGILTGPETTHISYIHTPPRYLYGFETSVNWQKYWLLRVYARVVNYFLRQYDFVAAQRPDVLIANSENTRRRIQKFYRRDAKVIYPPVELPKHDLRFTNYDLRKYFLIVSRVVGGKGLELAVQACTELGLPLKVVGEPAGWSSEYKKIKKSAGPTIEFLGFVSDEELVNLYSGAKAFLATARDEDFGMTVVEAQLCGIPVIAYKSGGYLETVIDGATGIFFNDYSIQGLKEALGKFKIQSASWRTKFKIAEIQKNAKRFSKERFVWEMKKVVEKAMTKNLKITAGF